MENKTKFAIGCLVQWYEINIIKEYISSIKSSINNFNKNNVIIVFDLVANQALEKFDGSEDEFQELINDLVNEIEFIKKDGFNVVYKTHNELYSIADSRRDFNNNYCEQVDILIWGESDMLAPKQMFIVLDHLHQQVKNQTPKYLSFFGGCKMWDDSWKLLEHPDFTDKPFIEGDSTNWWSLRYTMTEEEMDTINNKTESPEVVILPQHKFNGCGLVISSEVIKAGANIPKGVFMAHEDTAFMHMTNKLLGNIPQFVIRNILLVHNRKHHSKRYKVKGETGIDPTNTGLLRLQHDWFKKQKDINTENLANLFNPNYKFKTWKDVWK
jgi:hypothetical protein